jgi:hypothetical protein
MILCASCCCSQCAMRYMSTCDETLNTSETSGTPLPLSSCLLLLVSPANPRPTGNPRHNIPLSDLRLQLEASSSRKHKRNGVFYTTQRLRMCSTEGTFCPKKYKGKETLIRSVRADAENTSSKLLQAKLYRVSRYRYPLWRPERSSITLCLCKKLP